MSDFDRSYRLLKQVRKNILLAIIDLESKIYHRGIDIGPLKPRNVILKEPIDDSKSGVVIVDFENAFNRCDQKYPPNDPTLESVTIHDPKSYAGQYISPLLRRGEIPKRFID